MRVRIEVEAQATIVEEWEAEIPDDTPYDQRAEVAFEVLGSRNGTYEYVRTVREDGEHDRELVGLADS